MELDSLQKVIPPLFSAIIKIIPVGQRGYNLASDYQQADNRAILGVHIFRILDTTFWREVP